MEWAASGSMTSPNKLHEVMEVSSVFYPIDRETALAKTKISAQKNYLWVGRLNENKDPLNVIKAFLAFADHYPDANLYMLYHTEELLPEIKTLLTNHPNADKIILVGKVLNDEMLYWYNSANFIVSGSRYEGSGTAVCEAMSCGCVPVITDIHSFRSMTDNGNCGILYEPGNEQALLTALLHSQQIELNVYKQKVLDFFQETLSFKAIATKFHAIASSL
jgi:glycosyltransferase involved in cell wall biosynthesis